MSISTTGMNVARSQLDIASQNLTNSETNVINRSGRFWVMPTPSGKRIRGYVRCHPAGHPAGGFPRDS